MFTDILKKELKVNFYKDINCDAFEIPNFLSWDSHRTQHVERENRIIFDFIDLLR